MQVVGRQSLHEADQRGPLHAVADPPDQSCDARHRQGGCCGKADVPGAHQNRPAAHQRPEPVVHQAGEQKAAEQPADAPRSQKQAQPAVARGQRALGIRDLDRRARLEEDQHERGRSAEAFHELRLSYSRPSPIWIR